MGGMKIKMRIEIEISIDKRKPKRNWRFEQRSYERRQKLKNRSRTDDTHSGLDKWIIDSMKGLGMLWLSYLLSLSWETLWMAGNVGKWYHVQGVLDKEGTRAHIKPSRYFTTLLGLSTSFGIKDWKMRDRRSVSVRQSKVDPSAKGGPRTHLIITAGWKRWSK